MAVSDDGRSEVVRRGADLWLHTPGRDDQLLVPGDGSLCVEPARGLECVRVLEPFSVEFFPDGRRVAFSSAPGRGENIFAVDLATRRVSWIGWAFGYEHFLVREGPWAGDFLLAGVESCSLVDGRTGRFVRDVTALDRECLGTRALRRALRFRLACYDISREADPPSVESCTTTMAACEDARANVAARGYTTGPCRFD
ncbi:MAG: hypothetical protein IT373_16675 [Polyangiaceae bacterium]|nr:hypothetical protein [Polyangiaceae bacterium]